MSLLQYRQTPERQEIIPLDSRCLFTTTLLKVLFYQACSEQKIHLRRSVCISSPFVTAATTSLKTNQEPPNTKSSPCSLFLKSSHSLFYLWAHSHCLDPNPRSTSSAPTNPKPGEHHLGDRAPNARSTPSRKPIVPRSISHRLPKIPLSHPADAPY